MKNLVLILLLVPGLASAVEWNQAQLTWTIVNSYDDFSPIIAPVTYRVYAGKRGTTKAVVATVSTPTALRSNIPEGDWCWQVAAVVNNVEGAKSEEVCKNITRKATSTTPAQVTGLTVE